MPPSAANVTTRLGAGGFGGGFPGAVTGTATGAFGGGPSGTGGFGPGFEPFLGEGARVRGSVLLGVVAGIVGMVGGWL